MEDVDKDVDMKFIEDFLTSLVPELLVTNQAWLRQWHEQQKTAFYKTASKFFLLTTVSYLFHYFFVDPAEGLSTSKIWITYRFSMAGIGFACCLIYFFGFFKDWRFYKLPAFVVCTVFCYFQTRTIIWYPKVPYLYSYIFILASVGLIGGNLIIGLLYTTFLSVLISPTLAESGESSSMILSASVVTGVMAIFLRSKYQSDLNFFVEGLKNTENQIKLAQVREEFTNQIRAFLPKEISRRLMIEIEQKGKNVLQATDEVLSAKKMIISCLFSDIRGFTKGTEDLNGFVVNSLLPNLKSATLAVERFEGVSRKIGDLLFAYYDSRDENVNLLNSVLSALEISLRNSEHNETLPEALKIKRYILISYGEAIVGNLGGIDSSIEISAIGSPVNLLSRIDELTKKSELRSILESGDIILTSEAAIKLKGLIPQIELSLISISSLGLKIRDFEKVEEIFLLPISKRNYSLLSGASHRREALETKVAV